MTTRLPINMISDGTPNTLLGRDGAGNVVEKSYPGMIKEGKGMFLSKTSSTSLSISSGYRKNGSLHTGAFASVSKDISSLFAAGDGNGSLDTGVVASNTWYYVFVIQNNTTSNNDILTSISANAPTIPANYTLINRIGSFFFNTSSEIEDFTQIGNYFCFKQPYYEGSSSAGLGTSLPIINHHLPNQIELISDIYVSYHTSSVVYVILYSISDGTQPTPPSGVQLALSAIGTFIPGISGSQTNFQVYLNNSNQIRYNWYAYAYSGSHTEYYNTIGWYDLGI